MNTLWLEAGSGLIFSPIFPEIIQISTANLSLKEETKVPFRKACHGYGPGGLCMSVAFAGEKSPRGQKSRVRWSGSQGSMI